jgi:sialate O-acetylesterase
VTPGTEQWNQYVTQQRFTAGPSPYNEHYSDELFFREWAPQTLILGSTAMRKATMATVLLVGLAACQLPRAEAAVKLHGLFTDNMVLQRDMTVPVWGTADPDETVSVAIDYKPNGGFGTGPDRAGRSFLVKADKEGKWSGALTSMFAGGPYTLTVKGGNNTVELKNVMVGEVWIASGQSNMEWPLQQTRDPKDAIAASKNPNIRLFDVPKTPKSTPQADLGNVSEMKNPAAIRTFGKWLECDPSTVPGFSAVGYYFGSALQRDLKVPVGIINSSWGGTAAERWTSKATLEGNPELKGLKGSDLYNGMIVPLQPFAFRGVIWYQGESNAGRAKQYFHLMNAMIKSWRDDWKQGEFPFLTVQLAPYDAVKVEGQWAELREAQLFTSLKVKNTAMAVITDVGDPKNIHPQDKKPVSERLALAARALVANNRGSAGGGAGDAASSFLASRKVEYVGPLYDSMKIDGDKAVLTFKHTGGGLTAKGGKGGLLTGFTIAGQDGKFVNAEARIVEDTVVVRSPEVPQPAAVRYGWANYPVVNLFNWEGLPATPFRTDVPDYYK